MLIISHLQTNFNIFLETLVTYHIFFIIVTNSIYVLLILEEEAGEKA